MLKIQTITYNDVTTVYYYYYYYYTPMVASTDVHVRIIISTYILLLFIYQLRDNRSVEFHRLKNCFTSQVRYV